MDVKAIGNKKANGCSPVESTVCENDRPKVQSWVLVCSIQSICSQFVNSRKVPHQVARDISIKKRDGRVFLLRGIKMGGKMMPAFAGCVLVLLYPSRETNIT